MKAKNTFSKPANVEIDRATLRFANTLLGAYRNELGERLAYASYSQADELGRRMNQIKETQTAINEILER